MRMKDEESKKTNRWKNPTRPRARAKRFLMVGWSKKTLMDSLNVWMQRWACSRGKLAQCCEEGTEKLYPRRVGLLHVAAIVAHKAEHIKDWVLHTGCCQCLGRLPLHVVRCVAVSIEWEQTLAQVESQCMNGIPAKRKFSNFQSGVIPMAIKPRMETSPQDQISPEILGSTPP